MLPGKRRSRMKLVVPPVSDADPGVFFELRPRRIAAGEESV
jgi:hypothetical protein